MKKEISWLSSNQKTMLYGYMWVPETKIKAILQITHGMKEFIDRYDDFAQYLNQSGILVVGMDLLGHGKSIQGVDYGFFDEEKGNAYLLEDIHQLYLMTHKRYPNCPYFMLGHSMGSFLLRQYLGTYQPKLSGAIIMGTGNQTLLLLNLASLLLKFLMAVKGKKAKIHQIDQLLNKVFNRSFRPTQTMADWISRDEKMVALYINNPLCTFDFTLAAYHDMVKSLKKMNQNCIYENIPCHLPIFLVAGKQDPVGNFGKGVEQLKDRYLKAGFQFVDMKLYPNDRHEILNELDRKQVYDDLKDWLEKRMGENEDE